MTISSLDLAISQLVQSITFTGLEAFLHFISFIGNLIPMFIILAVCFFYFYFTRHRKAAAHIFFAAVAGAGISTLLKQFFARPRPSSELVNVLVNLKDFGFPSTHCVSFTVVFGFLYYYLTIHNKKNPFNRPIRLILITLILSVGVSRIYLGAHWLTDCLAGYLLGYLVLIVTIKIFKNER